MNEKIDYIIDRRNLRRKISFWRIFAIFATLIALGAIGFASFDENNTYTNHIAKIEIYGTITHDPELLELIEHAKTDENVKAVIFAIDSPGGTTVGGEALYDAIKSLSAEKPTVAAINTLGASAAYLIATATQHIVARQTSIVGSIGVIFQYPQIDKMLEELGIEVKEIKSSPLKAAPSIFLPQNEAANTMIQNMINDSYKWFKNLVALERGFSHAEIDRLADGSVFTGNQALRNNLIDATGGIDTAITWLETEKDIAEKLEVIILEPQYDEPYDYFGINTIIDTTLDKLGIKNFVKYNKPVDGLVSIWQN